ncbi:unnamed protein product [Rangifer tarandus platyrhynchus]|uniref:Uncharacterized protein n=2 Tax=Rangifer tarandus platyrhynchus TaxID=3082113 RepID=A0ABN8YS85_RANTA|nr:unnamed protein product [Rangifer tarandus platyrhynchus]CAI9702074.1 unnamed protein product [Rangifer tarandus platyrhynchus]
MTSCAAWNVLKVNCAGIICSSSCLASVELGPVEGTGRPSTEPSGGPGTQSAAVGFLAREDSSQRRAVGLDAAVGRGWAVVLEAWLRGLKGPLRPVVTRDWKRGAVPQLRERKDNPRP